MVLVWRADISFFVGSSPNHGLWDISFSSPAGTISAVQALIWSFLLTALTAKCKGKLPAAIYLYLTGFRGKKGLSRNVSWNLRGDSYLHRMPPPQSFKATAHAQKKPCISASCKWTPIPIPFPSIFFSCLFLLRPIPFRLLPSWIKAFAFHDLSAAAISRPQAA